MLNSPRRWQTTRPSACLEINRSMNRSITASKSLFRSFGFCDFQPPAGKTLYTLVFLSVPDDYFSSLHLLIQIAASSFWLCQLSLTHTQTHTEICLSKSQHEISFTTHFTSVWWLLEENGILNERDFFRRELIGSLYVVWQVVSGAEK